MLRRLEEGEPASLVLLLALADAENASESVHPNADGHQDRDILYLAAPTPLEHDAVQVDIGKLPLQRLVPPALDVCVDLLVELSESPRFWDRF